MNDSQRCATVISEGQATLGIELGSTRIKGVLLDEDCRIIASGSHQWENQLIENVWTYDLSDAWAGLQACFADVARDVRERYGVPLTRLGGLGVSGMMHGYWSSTPTGCNWRRSARGATR